MFPSRNGAARAAFIVMLLAGVLPGAAIAFTPPLEAPATIDRLAPEAPLDADRAAAIEASLLRSPAWRDWSRQHPAWRVDWNLRTRTPHRLYGPGLRVAGPLNSATLESACRDFLASSAALTGVRPDALRLIKTENRLGRWYVIFDQVENGVPVRGGRVDLRLGAGGEVVLFGSDWHRDVHVSLLPSVSNEVALASASRDLGTAVHDAKHELVVVPEPAGDGYTYHLAWELRFTTREPRGSWLALVDAQSGALLRREDQIRYAQLSGRVTSMIEPITVDDPQVESPLRATQVDGPTAGEFGLTDPDGNFDFTTGATDSCNVRIRLAGAYGRVFNQQLGFATPTINSRMLPGSPRDYLWSDSNSRTSERDAYFNALRSHQNIKELDPSFTGLDYQMPIRVDIFDRDCNAFYDGFGINFFGESMRCVNTARIADVVMHEYGHGITDQAYRPVAPSGAMHEGFSDYWAATIMNSPIIGVGFRGPGTFLRTIDNTRHFPEDITGEVHNDGLIIGGALWDMREALGKAHSDTLFHFARYGGTDNFDDYLLDVLFTDDNNADIYDGTPNFDAIIAAFSAHGIGDYSVQIAHDPVPDTEDLLKPLRIDATILSIFALEPATLQVHWRVNGGPFATLPLTPTGGGSRDFSVTLPSQPTNTDVAYYITAADTAEHAATLPPGGAVAPFTFRVGIDTTPPVIAHEPLRDQPLDSPGWALAADVTDNLDHGLNSVLAKYRRNAGGEVDLPLVLGDPPHWRGVLPAAGVGLGDSIFYHLVATDSATVPNLAQDPSTGEHAFRIVRGFGRDFEANDGGLVPDGDWLWGEPTGDIIASSPTHCWGTGITDSYSNNQESFLETGPIDLTGWQRAALVFQHHFATEFFFDGGDVQVTTDGGTNWASIPPDRGYNLGFVQALSGPGFSGDSGTWRRAAFDLSQFLGQTIALRWRFASDSGVVDRGWFVDDLQVVERQILAVPMRLLAQSGLDSEVRLHWSPPAGIDPNQPGTPLVGYHVYRSLQPDLGGAVRLTTAPLAAPDFLDDVVVNGTDYWYAVTALYADGESPRSTAAGALPYRAQYASNIGSLYMPVPVAAPADSSITFSNPGTGFLNMNVWLGDAGDADLDAVRIAYTLAPPVAKPGATPAPAHAAAAAAPEWKRFDRASRFAALGHEAPKPQLRRIETPAAKSNGGGGEWQLLFTDTSEGATPDYKGVYVQESGGALSFKLTGWQAWNNPLVDFNTVIGIDADTDRSTGDEGGTDLYVLIGPFALAQIGAPAAIVTSDQQIVDIPPIQLFPSGADSMIVGFARQILGPTQRIGLNVISFSPNLQVPGDLVPDFRFTGVWMQPGALHVSVPAGAPQVLPLHFPGTVPAGRYQGKIFLETNAPDDPAVTIPVTHDLGVESIELQELTAQQIDADVVVRWRTGLEENVHAFRVFRGRDGGALQALEPDVVPDTQHTYSFRDRQPEPGAYTYRIGEVDAHGEVSLHGSVQILVGSTLPRTSFLDPAVPNPFNPSTTLRFGIAVRGPARLVLYDTRGRLVRTLMQTPDAQPGIYRLVWNGRDERGAQVASGVYHARFETAGRTWTRRLTLVK